MHRQRANICWRPVPAVTPTALYNLTKTAETRGPGLRLEAAATLSRIPEVTWSREEAEPPVIDQDWEAWVTLRVSPHQGLGEEQRKTVERDYAMRNGVLKLKVRKAMEGYLRDRLGLTMPDGKLPVRLLE